MEEEEEIMDYHCLKRKKLQALCKRHGVSANLSNREMADRLCSIIEERGNSSLKNSSKKLNEKALKVVKKVRFSPENQTIFYEVSGYKRAGGRKGTMKSLPKKHTQAIENKVSSPPLVGRKRPRRNVKNETVEVNRKTAVKGDGNAVGGLITRQLRTRELVVGNSSRDSRVTGPKVVEGGSKMARTQVSEGNATVEEDAKLENLKTGGRITRSRSQFVCEASESGDVQGQREKFPRLEGQCNGVGRNASMGKSAVPQKGRAGKESLYMDAAEPDRVLRHSKQRVTKEEGYEALGGNSRKGKCINKIARAPTKTAGSASAAENETDEEIVKQNGLGRYAFRRKSVMLQRVKVVSDGLEDKKETKKRSRNLDFEGASELEAIIEPNKEPEMIKKVVSPSGPSRRTRRNKSTVPYDVELETDQRVKQKDAHLNISNPRRSSRNVADISEPDEVLQDEDSVILSRNTRKFKIISRITRSQTKTARKASALQRETGEENLQPEEPSKGRGRYVSRRKSVVLPKNMVENDEIRKQNESRKRSCNTNPEGASEREAFVEPTKEFDTVKNISIFGGPSRRTRRNTVMFKSTASVDRELEDHQIAGQEDAYLMKYHTRWSNRNASRNHSTVNSSEVGGVSRDVGKVRQQKARRELAVDEDTSVSKLKSLPEEPPRRSARNASKSNLVEPVGPTGKAAGKKHHIRLRGPVMVQEVPFSDNLSAPEEPIIEDARVVLAESARDKNDMEASCRKVPEDSKKKRKVSQMKVRAKKKLGSLQVSTVNSGMEKAKYMVFLEDEFSFVGNDKLKPVLGDTLEVNKDDKSCCSLNRIDDFGDSNPIELADVKTKYNYGNVTSSDITSPAVDLPPVNQSSDFAEPSNIMDLGKVLEAEEPSTAKNINRGSNDVDDQSNKYDRASVQEYQNLVQLGHKEETSAVIQEAVFEEHLNEISRSSSEKKSEIPNKKAEHINVIDPCDAEGNSHSENFLRAFETKECTAESHLVISETGIESTTKIQLTSGGNNVTEATPCKAALENEDFTVLDINDGPIHAFVASNDAMEGNANCAPQELFRKELEFSDEIICIGETSIGNVHNGICDLANTSEGVTTEKNEPQELVHGERASLVGEKSITDGYEENLLVDGSSVSVLLKTDGKDDNKKEHEVSVRCSLDAVEKENEKSEKSSSNVSEETRGSCMDEISEAEEINLITTKEKGAAELQKTLVASFNLQSPGTVDKGSFPHELVLLESNNQNGKVSSICTKSSSYKGSQSMHNDMAENLKANLSEDAKFAEVQAEYLPQFALEDLPDEVELDRRDVNSTFGEVLIQLTGDCDSIKRIVAQVNADGIGDKASPMCKSELAVGSEVVPEKIHDHADFVGERNCTVDIAVEQYANVVKEDKAECDIKVELHGKSDQEQVASLVNEAASTSLTEIISKDCEDPDDKAVEIMIMPSEYIGGVENLVVEEFQSRDGNSDAEFIHVGALAQVIDNHLVEEEATERHDDSVQSIGIVAEVKTCTVAIKRADCSEDADNGETVVRISSMMPDKTFRSEFEDIEDPAPGVLNEVLYAQCKYPEIKSNEIVSTVPLVDEPNFGDIDYYKEEKVLELERIAYVTSDNLISITGRAGDKAENVETMDRDLDFKDNCCDIEKEDNIDGILHVAENTMDDHLIEVRLYNASANIRVFADDAGDISMNQKVCSQNIEDGTEWVGAPTFSQTIKSERKWDERKSAEGKYFAETSFAKPETCSSTALPFPGSDATDIDSQFETDDQAKKNTSLRYQKDNEGLNDSIDDHKGAFLGTASLDDFDCTTSKEPSCSNRWKSIAKVAEEGIPSEKLSDMAVTADIEKSAYSLTPRLTTDCSAFSPIIVHSNYGMPENKSFDFHVDSPQLTSWEMNRILGSGDQVDSTETAGRISEINLMTQDRQDAVEVKEYLVTNKQVDQQATEMHLGGQKHHTHLATLDEPIGYHEESEEQNESSAINQEHIDCEMDKDNSYVSAEKVMLVEAAASRGINVADLYKFKAESYSGDSKEADSITVDCGVSNCSESRGVAMDMGHREASKTVDMLEEVEQVGTSLPVAPEGLCVDCENPKEISHETAGTVLEHIYFSGKEIYEHEVNSKVYSKGADRTEMFDEDRGSSYTAVALLFEENNEATTGKRDTNDVFGVEINLKNSQEFLKEQFYEPEHAGNESTSCSNKSARHLVEAEAADGLHRLDGDVVTAGDPKEVVNPENLNIASTLTAEIAVDCSSVSQPGASSNYENKALEFDFKSHLFKGHEMNLFLGPGEQDVIGNSEAEALETNLASKSQEVKVNAIIVEQIASQVTKEQLGKHEMAEEDSKLKCTVLSDLNSPPSASSRSSTVQGEEHAFIHGTANDNNCKNEPLKFESTNSAGTTDTAVGDVWRFEQNLLSPQNRIPSTKKESSTLFSKKLNSSMRKQNSRSALIQRTPKLTVQDMKENVLSTKSGKTGNITAQRALSNRRALENLQKR